MKLLHGPGGEEITGSDEDELVTNAKQHLAAVHPDRADEYEREHILFMALDVPDPPS
jgi:hypothetical protein